MCGIAGCFIADSGVGSCDVNQNFLYTVVGRMAATLAHRGPDDSGVWADEGKGIGLAHRRLAILDLSLTGHQPMVSTSGQFVIVFNGEIYNHASLREEIQLASGKLQEWRGYSDTETLLAAFELWGVEAALNKCVGMFALALWDRKEGTVTLARDRMGEKPLYYGWQGEVFLFASELKAFRAHPAFRGAIDRNALALFFRYNYIPTPWTIYQGVRKLSPGSFLVVRSDGEKCEPTAYWSARTAAEDGQSHLFEGSDEEARDELDRVLRDAVAGQMVADVPLGAFLSGGIDSSTVVALMQAQSSRPIRTFTIGFVGAAYNEAKYATAVARYLGTKHTELYVTPEDAMTVIPDLAGMYDEPFADSSQIPTFLVAKLARRHVAVALSGDGGDELFGGYNRHDWLPRIWQRLETVPKPLRAMLAGGLTMLSPRLWDILFYGLGQILPKGWQGSYVAPGDKMHKLADIVKACSPEEMYTELVSFWRQSEKLLVGGGVQPVFSLDTFGKAGIEDFAHRMMSLDMRSYLPDDILVKVDRAAMAVSLETRIPMLDHRVVEFAWRLPLGMKIRGGQGKWLLRQVLYQYVPPEFVERPKMGFGLPLGAWLRGPLREWAEELLDESRLQREGFLYPGPIRKKWHEHLSGRRNWAYHLWSVLMFQAWLEMQRCK